LPDNDIGPAGVQSLLRAAQEHPALREIHLEGNRRIGYEGARLIGNELPNLHHIIHLDITDIIRWSDHVQVNAKIQAEQALMNGVIDNTGILKLLLSKDEFSGVFQDSIRLYTRLNDLGRYLLATENGLPSTIWCHVFETNRIWEISDICRMRYAASAIYFFLREQPHLVQPR
jgi:hypothetical protein